ncbi:MAG: CopG family ribbon-helix-helix protein [Promethearchaeota archaeon]
MTDEKKEFQRFSISLPKSLFTKFESFREENNMERSDAIRKAMREYLYKEKKEHLLNEKEKISAVVILTIKHLWEGDIQDHNHDNLSSDEHSKEHSHEKMGNQKDQGYPA